LHDYSGRFLLFLERLEQQGLDGFLVIHPANLAYLFNFRGSDGLALTLAGEARLLVDSRYIEEASQQAVNCRAELCEGPLLAGLVRRLQATTSLRIGFESHALLQRDFSKLSAVPNTHWHPQVALVQELRQLKSQSELDLMRENFERAHQALGISLELLDPGWREIDFAGSLEFEMRRAGADGFAFETIVASGARASLPHGLPSEKIIGDAPLLIDFGLKRRGYCTDLTRMRAYQSEVAGVAKIVRDARQAAFECIRPGVSASQVDAAAREHISRAGYGEFFGHSLGHGLGLEVHELPRIGPGQEALLESGMVFTLEPGIYLPGRFGVRIEDVVVVGEDAAGWLSDPEQNNIELNDAWNAGC